jgi:hypothetical protein
MNISAWWFFFSKFTKPGIWLYNRI